MKLQSPSDAIQKPKEKKMMQLQSPNNAIQNHNN